MFGLRISVDTTPLQCLDRGLQNAPRTADKILGQAATDFDNTVFAQLTAIPPKHSFAYGAFPWTTQRQKRAFFATDGFGRGIPTTRTGAIARGWQLRQYRRGGIRGISLRNIHPAARFLYGTLNIQSPAQARRPQQRFHKLIGWPTATDVVGTASRTAVAQIKSGFTKAFEIETGIRIRRRSFR